MKYDFRTALLFGMCGACAVLAAVGFVIPPQPSRAEQKVVAKTAVAGKTGKTVSKTAKVKTAKKPTGIFGRFLRKVIPAAPGRIIPKKRTKFHIPDDPAARRKALNARDHIDARAPHDPDDIKRMRRIEERIEAKDYRIAVRVIQNLLDRKDDSMIRNQQGEWISVRSRVNALMAKQPDAFHRFYEVSYGSKARLLLADALKTGDQNKLAEVATRYFHTKSGLDASRRLAVLALDRGDYGVAARWYARLLSAKSDGSNDPLWMLQAAYAYRRSGDNTGADELVKRIESATSNTPLVVGKKKIVPRVWLKKFTEEHADPARMREWWTLFGNAARNARAVGGDPLLLSRWSKQTTYSHAVRKKISEVLESLRDSNRALIPASIPLAVDGRIIFRTLRGVLVVDADTGEAQWESRSGITAEKLLTSNSSSSNRYSRLGMGFARGASSRPTNADLNPATGLLFHNGNHGLLSSDGRQVFVIEKMALLPKLNMSRFSSFTPAQGDRYHRSWLTNKLAAYDLKTGRPNWEIGGKQNKESFDLPLAGTFFLGVPVFDKGELFVIGERDNRIRLHVLDARTGKPKWSRLLAYSDTKISKDSVRRWLTAQVAVNNGVIVCPTTVGWMIGVDRTNGAVLWGHRYSKPGRSADHNQSSNHNLPTKPLNERWLTSAPVIASGHVVFTPQEEASAVCLRLRDGKQRWKIPKSDYLYQAGVVGGNVVLVGKTAVTAVSLEKGETVWTRKIDKSDGPPSGMGVAIGNRYHLPLHSGQLWTIDLVTGKVAAKSYLPKSDGALGNLVMYRGQVISLGPMRLTSYEQRDALLSEIRKRKSANPTDNWATLKEAEIALLGRKFDESLTHLKKVQPEKLDDATKPRYRRAMLRTLTAIVRRDFKQHDEHFARLKSFAQSEEERFELLKLTAQRNESRGNLVAAFEDYRNLADRFGGRKIRRRQTGHVELSAARWATGRLAALWKKLPVEARPKVDAIVARAIADAGGNLDQQRAIVQRYAFHPASIALTHKVADRLARAGRFAAAENLLLRLRTHTTPEVAVAGLDHQARLLESQKLPRDAAVVYARLQRLYPKTKLADGTTVLQHLAKLKTAGRFVKPDIEEPLSWADSKMQANESGMQYRSYPDQQFDLSDSSFPFFAEHSFVVDRTDQQLLVRNNENDELVWLAPLRAQNAYSNGYYVFSETYGHCLLVLHDRVLQCLSPIDRKILWSRPVLTNSTNVYHSFYSSTPNSRGYRALQRGTSLKSNFTVARRTTWAGGIAFANERCVGLFGKRRLEIVDAITGELMWTMGGLTPGDTVIATTEAVFVTETKTGRTTALRIEDGERIEKLPTLSLIPNACGIYGRHLLIADVKSTSFLGFNRSTVTWKLIDPLSGSIVWQKTGEKNGSHGVLQDGTVAMLSRTGTLELINPQTGEASSYKVGPDTARSGSVYVFPGRDTIFVAASRHGHSSYSYGLRTVYISGEMLAFDRRSHRQIWKRELKSRLGMITDEFARSPVLTFMTQKYERIGNIGMQKIHIRLLDKRTGRLLYDRQSPATQSYGAFAVNRKERSVEFQTYNSRLRITAVEPRKAIQAPRPKTK